MAQLSNSERSILYNMHREISTAFSEQNYTFEFNPKTIKLDLVSKTGPTCHTRHTISKTELYNWYKNELLKFEKYGATKESSFVQYAKYYKLDFYTYIELLKQTIRDAEEQNPEYFI